MVLFQIPKTEKLLASKFLKNHSETWTAHACKESLGIHFLQPQAINLSITPLSIFQQHKANLLKFLSVIMNCKNREPSAALYHPQKHTETYCTFLFLFHLNHLKCKYCASSAPETECIPHTEWICIVNKWGSNWESKGSNYSIYPHPTSCRTKPPL